MNGGKQATQLFAKEWGEFVVREQLTEQQADQFKLYMRMLKIQSSIINLTTITGPRNILAYHFRDSLQLQHAVDMKSIHSLCDVGTGGGFPGIPLKILFPRVQLTLIEVNKKKICFLESMIQELELDCCRVCPLDWRTFLRKTEYEIDLFCVRAALQPEELIRMFKPSCFYKGSRLVYWASSEWNPGPRVQPFVQGEQPYRINRRNLKLVFLGLPNF